MDAMCTYCDGMLCWLLADLPFAFAFTKPLHLRIRMDMGNGLAIRDSITPAAQ
jgi:hypothetical protein